MINSISIINWSRLTRTGFIELLDGLGMLSGRESSYDSINMKSDDFDGLGSILMRFLRYLVDVDGARHARLNSLNF